MTLPGNLTFQADLIVHSRACDRNTWRWMSLVLSCSTAHGRPKNSAVHRQISAAFANLFPGLISPF